MADVVPRSAVPCHGARCRDCHCVKPAEQVAEPGKELLTFSGTTAIDEGCDEDIVACGSC